MKTKAKTLTYDLYGFKIDVCIGTSKELLSHAKRYYKKIVTDPEEFNGLMKSVTRDKYYGTNIGISGRYKGYAYQTIYINIERYPSVQKSVYSVFTHELWHAVDRIARRINLSRGEDCAYLAGDAIEKCLPMIKEAEKRVSELYNNLEK